MNISVVLATFNRKPKLMQTLHSLTSQTCSPQEIIVVDNGSTDGTGEFLKEISEENPIIKPLFHGLGNIGPAKARNLGATRAFGEILAFTDDDCIAPPEWIEAFEKAFQDDSLCAVGGYLEAASETLKNNIFARYESFHEHRQYHVSDSSYISTQTNELPFQTNNIAYRRSDFLELGGFDDSFGLIPGEDGDLKERALKTGKKFLYIPVKMTHMQDYTFKRFWNQSKSRGASIMEYRVRHHMHVPGKAVLYMYMVLIPIKVLVFFLSQNAALSITFVELLAQYARNMGKLEYKRQ